jgi:hypothetical protein
MSDESLKPSIDPLGFFFSALEFLLIFLESTSSLVASLVHSILEKEAPQKSLPCLFSN